MDRHETATNAFYATAEGASSRRRPSADACGAAGADSVGLLRAAAVNERTVGETTRETTWKTQRWVRPALFALVALVAGVFLLPKIPRTQQVRLHLGVGSSHVVAATARIGRDGVWDRQTTWRFDHGAPPSFEWAFDLPNGPANVEVELSSTSSTESRALQLDLHGEEANVELADATRGLE